MNTAIITSSTAAPVASRIQNPTVASVALKICEVITDRFLVLITELRKKHPFIRGVIREPLRQLHRAMLENPFLIVRLTSEGGVVWTIEPGLDQRNSWGEERLYTVHGAIGEFLFTVELYAAHPAYNLLSSVQATTDTISLEAEERAIALLQEQVSKEQFKMYRLTGTLIHEGTKFTYLIRRGFPTLVYERSLSEGGDKGIVFKLGLCAHGIGYYPGHFTGLLCPTDDVITHLVMLRGDEEEFWKRSSVHLPTSGLLGL